MKSEERNVALSHTHYLITCERKIYDTVIYMFFLSKVFKNVDVHVYQCICEA